MSETENDKVTRERQRIVGAYDRRQDRRQATPGFYGFEDLAHLVRCQERYRQTLRLLRRHGLDDLAALSILDVGCGGGTLLRELLQWGAEPQKLYGIDLYPPHVERCRLLSPNLDVRCGCATELPWPEGSFSLVCQHTMFTSILDADVRRQAAAEMARVLCRGGAVLWYDFIFDNPRNPDVSGVKRRTIEQLFPGFQIDLQRTTLVPFVARRIPAPLLPMCYPMLSAIPFLRTHFLGVLTKV